jgi:hypothetical protein
MQSTNKPQSPLEIKEIQEMAIAVSANNFSPNIINLEFLQLSGIIPKDWQLAREPVVNQNLVQLFFQNRVSIIGQQNIVTFIENIGIEEVKDLIISDIAKKFTQALPNADYQTVSFNPKSVIPMTGGKDAARKYITGTLLSPGSWQEIGRAPVQANLNLFYELDRCQLNVSINEANIQMPDQTSLAAVLFSGSFNYNVAKEEPIFRLNQIHKSIEHWDLDLSIFREMIEQRFLISKNSLFPASFTVS